MGPCTGAKPEENGLSFLWVRFGAESDDFSFGVAFLYMVLSFGGGGTLGWLSNGQIPL